jgi:hypothetical protein
MPAGCRRIAVEYDKHNCEPYRRPLPFELLVEYADNVCLILSVDDVSCEGAFEWTTTSTWEDLDHLIGVLCWSGFLGTRHAVALYDAIVPADRSQRAHQYDRPVDAVRDGRQLRWERQALRLLDSNQVTWRQLRNHLYIAGIIDPDSDFEAAEYTRTRGTSRLAPRAAHPRSDAHLTGACSTRRACALTRRLIATAPADLVRGPKPHRAEWLVVRINNVGAKRACGGLSASRQVTCCFANRPRIVLWSVALIEADQQ